MRRDPIICEVTRGTMVESRHRVHAMVLDSQGDAEVWGDPDLLFYPRSAIKYMQALPLIESGAGDAHNISEPELALASASHSGEAIHVERVGAWLSRLGLNETHLGCGAHLPYDEKAAHAMIHEGVAPTRLNNNCSGKHTGFLTTALHLGEQTSGYLDPDHPVQRRLYDIMRDLGDADIDHTGRGIDGCGIPVFGMTLTAVAKAAQKFANPETLGETRGRAAQRVLKAAMAEPYMVGGNGRFDTDVMKQLGGRCATKGGAEGVHVAILPNAKLGIALKVEDGNKRAGDVAMAWLLERTGVFDDNDRNALAHHFAPQITNAAGDYAGTIRVADFSR